MRPSRGAWRLPAEDLAAARACGASALDGPGGGLPVEAAAEVSRMIVPQLRAVTAASRAGPEMALTGTYN